MRYEWDERKRQLNLRKHGLDFADAPDVFEGPTFIRADTREDYGEDRWQFIGRFDFLPVVIDFTEPASGVRRLVSFRKAAKHERKLLEKAFED